MMRLDLGNDARLHIWNIDNQVKDVSIIHTHPWNFKSYVIAGSMKNINYKEFSDSSEGIDTFRHKIITGKNAHPITDPVRINLKIDSYNTYNEGDSYYQNMDIPHKPKFTNGTVTLIQRDSRLSENVAFSYSDAKFGKDRWISVALRLATKEEIQKTVDYTLNRYFYK